MNKAQLEQYDHFLDENDWDIYYWATQTGNPTSLEYAEGAVTEKKDQTTEYTSPASPGQAQETDMWRQGAPRSGEWAQTVGAFKTGVQTSSAKMGKERDSAAATKACQNQECWWRFGRYGAHSQQQGWRFWPWANA